MYPLRLACRILVSQFGPVEFVPCRVAKGEATERSSLCGTRRRVSPPDWGRAPNGRILQNGARPQSGGQGCAASREPPKPRSMAGMKIAVVGTGGIGGYYGAQLVAAGQEVHFAATRRHVAPVRERGLLVSTDQATKAFKPASITTDPAEIGPADIVLTTVKLYQLRDSMEQIAPLLGPDTLVVTTQNGVTAPATVAEYAGAERTVPGLCIIVSYIEGPGHIRQVGFMPKIQVGARTLADAATTPADEADGTDPRIQALVDALNSADAIASATPDIEHALWKKFALITTFGGVGGLARATIGQVRDYPPTRALQIQSLAEARAVANARGIPLTEADTNAILAQLDELSPESTTSMQRDIAAMHPNELEDLNGALVRLGAEVGVDAPLHRIATACMGLRVATQTEPAAI